MLVEDASRRARAGAMRLFTLFAYGVPVSKLAPIWSCNVLVTLAIGAVFLGEASELNMARLAAGIVFILSGALLVSSV
ncbi:MULTISPECIES: hypothetical protein [Rhizobium]|uniref:hypothetical protein n=1 Tax=Rhizobium sp. NLR16a TaxID=2731112 RepID=UPI001B31A586|nr:MULTISPECIES: hypothetical protein [Rhizobium]MBX4906304.1 hypothetical protein [Rhizobium bangladeshense]MBX5213163.1 hypothetical protein [Rhizobium sp. NLR9a]MBX5219832.1 hypothetical protein [Rhizobium sp. NLR8a]MBX5231184.1 hypothetical protein [Rhizobium sp. NLR4a]MBX5239476.1 hypothetical protein [Rhizobium sp. NLR22b]